MLGWISYPDVFKTFVGERQEDIAAALQAIPIPPIISIDHTFNVLKRTTEYNAETKLHKATDANGLHCNGRRWWKCVVLPKTKVLGGVEVESDLKEIVNMWPTLVCIDDCCAFRNSVKRALGPDADVTQDAKHLINRIVEGCSKRSPL